MPETPAYGGPPEALQALMERHQSPPQPAALTQSQETNNRAATTAGEQHEPGWTFLTEGPSAGADANATTGTTDTQLSQTTEPANAHTGNTGHEGVSERRSSIAADT